jgi:hypothetical protein
MRGPVGPAATASESAASFWARSPTTNGRAAETARRGGSHRVHLGREKAQVPDLDVLDMSFGFCV